MIGLEEKNKIVTGYHGIKEQLKQYYREAKEFMHEFDCFYYNFEEKCIEKLMSEAADHINMIMQLVEYYGGTEEEVLSYRHRKMSREVKRVNKAIETGCYVKE